MRVVAGMYRTVSPHRRLGEVFAFEPCTMFG
jgi:hypothetical protein